MSGMKLRQRLIERSPMIYAFNDIESLFALEERAQEEAAKNIPIWAGCIKAGDYFVQDVILGGDLFTIWSEVLPLQEEYNNLGDKVAPSYDGHAYRFTRSYSVICPEGELGDVHLSNIKRLVTKSEFEEARRLGWA